MPVITLPDGSTPPTKSEARAGNKPVPATDQSIVEASVRSLSSRDEPAIRAMVSRIIEERIADDQFDECDLTLRDIEQIREAFIEQLLGMYHQRVAYPQNKVVELESRRTAGER